MYQIKHITKDNLNYITLNNVSENTCAEICPDQGGRLSDFVFKNVQILPDFHPSTYKNNFASSILFPFANRVKDGTYTFKNKTYKLNCNEADKNNALHGLVYNKTFTCVAEQANKDQANITLSYTDNGTTKGFPYKYTIALSYTLNNNGLQLRVTIKNIDTSEFPFTLGWHPYFKSVSLERSSIHFQSNTQHTFDAQQIITGTKVLQETMPMTLNGLQLDNSYPLDNNTVTFFTPEYNLTLRASSEENYLQLYTPETQNTIAIEPMTGAANNFNNKLGLQILQPQKTYFVNWDLNIETSKY